MSTYIIGHLASQIPIGKLIRSIDILQRSAVIYNCYCIEPSGGTV